MNQTSSYMFYNFNSLTDVEDIKNWNTSSVTNMYYMFRNCDGLTNIDLSTWNVSKVTDMRYMFYDCNNLEAIDLTNWNTSKVNYI